MKEKVSLVFTGDIGFDRYMNGKQNDEKLISDDLLEFFRSADHVIPNVEGALVEAPVNNVTEGTAQLAHTMTPDAVKILKKIRADIWNLCNNHIMDAGEEGVAATLKEAEKAGVRTVGVGMDLKKASEPLILNEAGGIGIFAVGYRRGCKPAGENKAGCLNWNERDIIKRNIEEIKSKCRWCIVISHGGEEFTSLPSPYTRERYLDYLEMGADIVVSHHPHVPMNYEKVGNKVIFYSLGNFIFDTDYQRAQYNTEKGVLVKLVFTESCFDWEAKGLLIDRNDERIKGAGLPDIFENVDPSEYELLSPLAAKMFVAATKRQQIYLNPTEYKNADDAKWEENFMNPKRSGRVPGEALDFQIICPLAEKADEGAWKKSKLEKVKAYILEQM
ncbi:MAG: CapA family protein [Lachnospiraceae bacterium]|nr:CapA family protein [Lachnospiraceae bacterium]